jgi:hypothetical protein
VNYTELKANIQEICESTFTDAQLAMFTKQAEQKIYSTVDLPVQRFNVTGNLTALNKYLTMPSGGQTTLLYVYSLAVIDGSDYHYLLNKDVNFIREAYPEPAVTGVPRHYAIFDKNTFILGPTPDQAYTAELHYSGYPESIVTAGTTWLGDEFDSALLNGALIEAIRFMKGEPDIIQNYEKLYLQSITLLKSLSDGKLRQDMYRSGQPRTRVS